MERVAIFQVVKYTYIYKSDDPQRKSWAFLRYNYNGNAKKDT